MLFIKTTLNLKLLLWTTQFIPSHIKFFLNKQFLGLFWVQFRGIVSKKHGLMTSNLSKSYLIHTIEGVSTRLNVEVSRDSRALTSSLVKSEYIRPVSIFPLAFHKKTCDTVMWYLMNLVLNINYSAADSFNLQYSFVFIKDNFWIYDFINLYYLKARNF